MAVGAETWPHMLEIAGFRLGTASAGIKKPGRRDLVLMEIAAGSSVAGVFTRNAFCAAPVLLAKEHLAQGAPAYLVVNTGNANAGTGEQGMRDARAVCEAVARQQGVEPWQVLPFSTGVIGEKLPVEKLVAALPAAGQALSEGGWDDAGWGIMTTDTRPKGSVREINWQGETIRISGIAKGSGMIMPNMATMLAFVATDAKVDGEALQGLLGRATDRSFNRVTVDGDTSTNDACMLVATGRSGVEVVADGGALWQQFEEAVSAVLLELSHAIVRDGEGANKFVTVEVSEARSSAEALQVAYTVAHSPLVKTALFASDPNWGRILAAVGRAGLENLDVNALQIFLGDLCIVENGGRADSYTEEQGQRVMNEEEILIRICLKRGSVAEQVWTTDLSEAYVRINADYRS